MCVAYIGRGIDESRITNIVTRPPSVSIRPHLPWSPSVDGDIEARGASYAPRIGIASSRIVLFTLRERFTAIEKFARRNRYVNYARAYARDEYEKTIT